MLVDCCVRVRVRFPATCLPPAALRLQVSTLLMFTTMFYFLAILTYGISCPTGLFVPSILCGAAYGRLVSTLWVCGCGWSARQT